MRTIAVILAIAVPTGSAIAHGADLPGYHAVWTFDPWIVMPLFVIGGAYAIGCGVLSRQSSFQHPAHNWRFLAFWGGWLSLAAALVSPLHWLGERLFSFHMIEHEILMAVGAPLFVAARPLGILLWSLPRWLRRATGRLLRRPAMLASWTFLGNGRNATLLHGVAIWVWHAPPLFDAAVTDVALHRLQHLSFFLTAVLFWWSVFWRSETGAAAWHVVITMLHTSILGALMTLAPRVLYSTQRSAAAAWGLTPLDDQQLAGLIMWVPAGTIYAGAALALLALWIKRSSAKPGIGHAARAV